MEGTGSSMNRKICPKCGTANLEDARFCENCGTNIETFAAQGQQMSGSNYGGVSSQPQVTEKKPMPKWLLILIAETALLAFSIYGNTMAICTKKDSAACSGLFPFLMAIVFP